MCNVLRTTGLLVALAVLSLNSGPVAAQDSPEHVDPALCMTVPMTTESLVDRVERSAPNGLDAPETDEQIDDAALDAVGAIIRESIACTNANRIMSALALFSDRYLAERFGGENNDDLGHLIAALSREPAVADEADRLALVSIAEPAMHADASIAVTVTTANANATFVDRLRLIEVGEGWRIDRVEPVEEVAATPAP